MIVTNKREDLWLLAMDNDFTKYKEKIEKSLIKKALGYQYKEVIEEYSINEDGEKLSKKKVTTKDVPPDISAVKLLLESLNVSQSIDFENLTDEELKQEIKKAVELLENNDKNMNDRNNDKNKVGNENGT